ncbi:MAG: DinB family protein [Chitinophagaceae bacterium]
MTSNKADFLKKDFLSYLKSIDSTTPPLWGKMSLQQVVEHFTDYVQIASGKTQNIKLVTPVEHLQKSRDFLMSEKPFKENTPNPLLPEVPPPVRNTSIKEALKELNTEIDFFFSVFEQNNQLRTTNPFFGELNFEQNVQLLHKHALHHLRQFGIRV